MEALRKMPNKINVTNIERTVVDCIDDIGKAGGLEELLHCIEMVPFVAVFSSVIVVCFMPLRCCFFLLKARQIALLSLPATKIRCTWK